MLKLLVTLKEKDGEDGEDDYYKVGKTVTARTYCLDEMKEPTIALSRLVMT